MSYFLSYQQQQKQKPVMLAKYRRLCGLMKRRVCLWCVLHVRGSYAGECWSVDESGLAVFCRPPGWNLGFPNFTPSCCRIQYSRIFSPDPRAKRGGERERSLKAYSIPTGGKIGAVHQGAAGRRVEPGREGRCM